MSRDEKTRPVPSGPDVPKICPVGTSRVINKSLIRKIFSHFRSSSRPVSSRPDVPRFSSRPVTSLIGESFYQIILYHKNFVLLLVEKLRLRPRKGYHKIQIFFLAGKSYSIFSHTKKQLQKKQNCSIKSVHEKTKPDSPKLPIEKRRIILFFLSHFFQQWTRNLYMENFGLSIL